MQPSRHCRWFGGGPDGGPAYGQSLTRGRRMNLVESVRGQVVRRAISSPTFAMSWPTRRWAIREGILDAGHLSPSRLRGLGEMLSSIFTDFSAGQGAARDQAGVAAAGS